MALAKCRHPHEVICKCSWNWEIFPALKLRHHSQAIIFFYKKKKGNQSNM